MATTLTRRRHRTIVCSSDEEDEEPPTAPRPSPPPFDIQYQQYEDIADEIETDLQTVTLNSLNPTPNTGNSTTNRSGNRSNESIPLGMYYEEEEEVIGIDSTVNRNNNQCHFGVSESPVSRVLEIKGLRLKKEWIDSCLNGLQSVRGFQGMDVSQKAKLCFEKFLFSDMNFCGAGVLPPNVQKMHLVDLEGPFVLQVDEIVNISNPLRGRYKEGAPGIKRCLKLCMTDGVQRVFGMEYRPINDLKVLAPAGMKIAICNVHIRHGMLMLVPEVVAILGGSVKELEAARERLNNEINKPPRGKRSRTGVALPLVTRATLAAWPPQDVSAPRNAESTTSVNTTSSGASAQGMPGSASVPVSNRQRQTFEVPVNRNNVQPSTTSMSRPHESVEVPRSVDRSASIPLQAAGLATAHSTPVNDILRKDFVVPFNRNYAEPNTLSSTSTQERAGIPQHIGDPLTEVVTPARETIQTTSLGIPANYVPVEDVTVLDGGSIAEANLSYATDMDVEEITMVDQLEHDFIISRDKETPFTYMASLSAKLAAIEDQAYTVRGKIKCFMTDVKGFQYKQRAKYELRVYVDDGSLISEILIDHNIVQSGIGYSPQEVTSALAASEPKRVSEMKETLKQFQIFLVNFEGTMLIEMNKSCPVPVAYEMNQGCPASDALLLLKRLQSYSSSQRSNHSHLNPICLSP